MTDFGMNEAIGSILNAKIDKVPILPTPVVFKLL